MVLVFSTGQDRTATGEDARRITLFEQPQGHTASVHTLRIGSSWIMKVFSEIMDMHVVCSKIRLCDLKYAGKLPSVYSTSSGVLPTRDVFEEPWKLDSGQKYR